MIIVSRQKDGMGMPTTTGDIDMSRNIKTFACNVAAAGIAICFADRMLDNFNVVGVNEYVAYGILAVLAACISSVMTLVFGRKRNPFAKLSLGFFSNAMMVVIAIYVSTAYLGCGVVTDSFLDIAITSAVITALTIGSNIAVDEGMRKYYAYKKVAKTGMRVAKTGTNVVKKVAR